MLLLIGLTVLYVGVVEWAKKIFYSREQNARVVGASQS